MNKELPKNVRPAVGAALNDLKETCQRKARDSMDAKTDSQRASDCKAAGGAPCVADELAKGKSRSDLGLEMDHPLDVKLGGPADGVPLIPLSRRINGFFGGVARNTGNAMIAEQKAKTPAQPDAKVESISLCCPASQTGCPPPPPVDPAGHDHNAGPKPSYPQGPAFVTPRRAAVG